MAPRNKSGGDERWGAERRMGNCRPRPLHAQVPHATTSPPEHQTETRAVRATPVILKRADWASHETLWKGRIEGKDVGTGIRQADAAIFGTIFNGQTNA